MRTIRLRGDGMNSIIKEKVPVVELLAGLAEECCELGQAALKLRRVFDKKNPTPVKEEDAIQHLYEEIADVNLYMNMLDVNRGEIVRIIESKRKRWEDRLKEKRK